MKTVHQTSCPLNCWDTCGFSVTVEKEKVLKVEGDTSHPITKGQICGRGRMLEKRSNSSERLLYPLKKIKGSFERISWKQALDEIAGKMVELKENFPTTTILHSHDYANNGLLKYLDQRFFNCYGGVTELEGSLCWGAGIEAQFCDFGNSHAHSPEDIDHSNGIVIWGRNVSRTNIHLFQKLKERKREGIPIVVIDPIYNQTAKLADVHFCIKPGMDSLLAFGVMKIVIEKGLQDKEFIHSHSIGFSDLEKLLSTISMDSIEEGTGLSKDSIEQLATFYIEKPVSTFIGLGMQRYVNGGNTIRAIDALVAVTGNIGIPGGGANFGNLAVGQSFDIEALTLPGRKQATRTFTRMKQAESILNASDPAIKMMFITRSNPLTQVPDTKTVEEAFKTVETIVVIDQFLTDSAELADYILPCTTVFEEEDIYYASMYHHYLNYGEALVPPPGEAKSDLWIWQELSKRLDFWDDFHYTIDEFLKMGLGSLEKVGISLEKIKREKHIALPIKTVPWEDKKFQTPSGKYEFTSSRAKTYSIDGKMMLSYPDVHKEHKKYPYTLLSIHPARSNHSQHFHLIQSIQMVTVEVSEYIASTTHLRNGDRVIVYNDLGKIEGSVKILDNAYPTVINIDEGSWKKFGGSVNQLTSSKESDNRMGSTYYDCLVGIKKIGK